MPIRTGYRAPVADWSTIASLATAGGTLVLALATFAAVRSSNRSARLAEYSMKIGIRALLVPSRLEDPPQRIMWVDDHTAELGGSDGHVEIEDGNVYLAMSIRNAGSGIGVIQGWHLRLQSLRPDVDISSIDGLRQIVDDHPHAEFDEFRPQSRDLYVPGGDIGFWQAAIRDNADPEYDVLVEEVKAQSAIGIELLYTDHEGGQPSITLFVVRPREDGTWLCAAVRHWNLDRPDPR
jgi:hypothetical protein